MHNKYELINYIIAKKGYISYLELGLGERRETFDNIICKNKYGVDNNPNTKPDFLTTTDQFFIDKIMPCGCCLDLSSSNPDVIYIDAYHEYRQVHRDFDNALKCINPFGCIFMHDVGPAFEKDTSQNASGTAYMAWMDIRARTDFKSFSYQFNDGDIIGIVFISDNDRPLLEEPIHSWDYYSKNKEILLNKKTLDEIDDILA